MKLRLLLLSLFALAGSAAAQFTIVSGTVTDPNGIPYALGTITPTLVTSASPTFTSGGAAYTPPGQSVNLDGTGSFTMRLADNTALSPASTKWNFTVCSGAGTVQPAIGTGSVCFSLASPITISGSSQSISSNLNAVALALTNAATTTGTIAANSGSAGAIAEYAAAGGSRAITPDSLLTDASNTLTYAGTVGITVSSGVLRVPSGANGAPAITLNGTTDGIYHSSAHNLVMSSNGFDVGNFNATDGLDLNPGAVISFCAASNTGNCVGSGAGQPFIGTLNFTAATNQVIGIGVQGGASDGGIVRSGNSCRVTSDITLPVNTATTVCTWNLPNIAKAWAWQCQIPWTISAGTGTNTLAIIANASQTPTGTTNGSAEIKTTNTNTATEATTAISASGATTLLTSGTITPGASVFLSSTSGTVLASATAGTFAIQMTAAGTTATAAAKAGAYCYLY